MIRQNISLNNFKYICDLYSVGDDDYTIITTKQFVILRNISVTNSIAYDTDIYFIDKDIYDEIINEGDKITTKCVFPCFNSKSSSFSKSFTDFSTLLTNFKLEDEGGNVFKVTDNMGNYKNVLCDKLRIYHPFNKTDMKYIIYLDNVINDIHFHYFCQRSDNFTPKSTEEFIINSNVYSEYFEMYVPNLNYLFKENNLFFNDIYNIIKYCDTQDIMKYDTKTQTTIFEWTSAKDEDNKTIYNNVDAYEISVMPFSLLLNPFIIETNSDGVEEKIYYRISNLMYNNYNTFPLNITLYPFEESEDNNLYLLNPDYIANSDTFIREYVFSLNTKIDFLNNRIAIISKFEYPDKNKGITLQEAYAKYNGLTLVTDKKIDKNGNEIVSQYAKEYIGWIEDEYYNEIEENYEDIKEIKCCGFKFDIATDYSFSNIVYSNYYETKFIDDFAFDLTGLFDDWFNIPQILLVRVQFIDKYLGVGIMSGFNIIQKEKLKYIINTSSSDVTRISDIFKQNANQITTVKTKAIKNTIANDMSWNTLDAEKTQFNFIDKLNCSVIKQNSNLQSVNSAQINNTRIIYKPIFYKTQDLNNISLKAGMKQKIGVNLSNYMTKVEVFKLVIDDLEIDEIARNDIYVIFQINANTLTSNSGIYSILDNEDNYISSGTWRIS